jgi:hypothetical protein
MSARGTNAMAPLQARFAAALLNPEAPAPAGLRVRAGDSAARCLAVYRNNVVVSLIDALAERLPVVLRLVGEAFFRAMARDFVRGNPPETPLLAAYGDAFPDFIASFPPAAGVPYLADVARVEAARTRAYHAADADPLDARAFAAVEPERLPDCRLALHPSAAVIRSYWAVASIWAAHQDGGEPEAVDPAVPEDALVVRIGDEVAVERLTGAGFATFLAALADGARLGDAAAQAADETDDFDPAQALAALIGLGVVTGIARDQ